MRPANSVAGDVRAGVAALLYTAALLSPLWFFALGFGWHGRISGFMRNTDSLTVSVTDARSGREWRLQPGETIPMERGDYRIGEDATTREFDPSDTVLARSLTWDVTRSGVQAQRSQDIMGGLFARFALVVVGLLLAAMIVSLPPRRRRVSLGRVLSVS